MTEKENAYILQSVDAALSVIELLAKCKDIGAAEVARTLGIGKSTAFRLLTTLENRQFVKKDCNSRYCLGMKLVYLGSTVLDSFDIIKFAHPHLETLSLSIKETVHLVVWGENNKIRFIDKVVCPTATIRMESFIGLERPAYATATGKILLAYKDETYISYYLSNMKFKRYTPHTITDAEMLAAQLHEIRECEYGIDADESEIGLYCIARPVFDSSANVIAAISASGPSERMRMNKAMILQQLKLTCDNISRSIC